MNTPMPVHAPPLELAPTPGPVGAWGRFWFAHIDPIGLHAVRFLAGLLFLLWLLPVSGQASQLFGLNGWFDARAYVEASRAPEGPPRPIGWSVLFLAGNDAAAFTILHAAALVVVVLFTLGIWTRATGILTWVVVASYRANPLLDSPADYLMGVFAFYLAVGYFLLGHSGNSLAARLLGSHVPWRRSERATPSTGANLALRLLQVHLALFVVLSGLRKLQVGEWWSGTVFWYDLHSPFSYDLQSLQKLAPGIASQFFVLSAAAYATLAWQIGFPMFAWQPRLRVVLVGGALIGWLGAVYVLAQPLIGPALVVGCLSFLTPGEWRAAATVLGRIAWVLRRLVFGPGDAARTVAKPQMAVEGKR